MLTFSNPGELDLRLAQILGASVKTSNSPIGHFGSGLKYGIAIVLRLGGKITLHSGLTQYTFHTEPTTIRGKEFQLVWMRCGSAPAVQLPFTLDFGQDWQPWQAYREFWANAKDEGGDVSIKPARPAPGTTQIQIECPALDKAHAERHTFILQSTPMAIFQVMGDTIEVHRQGSSSVYYQGLKVFTTEKPGFYTYNITSTIQLTEDRTIVDWWSTSRKIIRALAQTEAGILGPVLLGGEIWWEWEANWDCFFGAPPDSYTECIKSLAQHHRHKLPHSIITSALPKELPSAVTLTKVEATMLARAKDFCQVILGTPITAPVLVVESLGDLILGSVHEDKILLTKGAFRQGTKIVAGTLFEEHLHLTLGLRDTSRSMQDHLLNLIIGLGEELRGEPL